MPVFTENFLTLGIIRVDRSLHFIDPTSFFFSISLALPARSKHHSYQRIPFWGGVSPSRGHDARRDTL